MPVCSRECIRAGEGRPGQTERTRWWRWPERTRACCRSSVCPAGSEMQKFYASGKTGMGCGRGQEEPGCLIVLPAGGDDRSRLPHLGAAAGTWEGEDPQNPGCIVVRPGDVSTVRSMQYPLQVLSVLQNGESQSVVFRSGKPGAPEQYGCRAAGSERWGRGEADVQMDSGIAPLPGWGGRRCLRRGLPSFCAERTAVHPAESWRGAPEQSCLCDSRSVEKRMWSDAQPPPETWERGTIPFSDRCGASGEQQQDSICVRQMDAVSGAGSESRIA